MGAARGISVEAAPKDGEKRANTVWQSTRKRFCLAWTGAGIQARRRRRSSSSPTRMAGIAGRCAGNVYVYVHILVRVLVGAVVSACWGTNARSTTSGWRTGGTGGTGGTSLAGVPVGREACRRRLRERGVSRSYKYTCRIIHSTRRSGPGRQGQAEPTRPGLARASILTSMLVMCMYMYMYVYVRSTAKLSAAPSPD